MTEPEQLIIPAVSKPYDAATKALIETDPAGWVAFLGCPVPPGAVSLVDADLSTVSAEADKVIRVEFPAPWLLHLELQASRDDTLERRMLRYHALLHDRHGFPVCSAAILLRPAANLPFLNGELQMESPIGLPWSFRYGVVRVWELPPAAFLNGPLGLLPLAPMSGMAEPEVELPGVVRQMETRMREVDEPELKNRLWIATYVLMGLRYNQTIADTVLSGVRDMEESVTYQAIVKRGLQQGMQQGMQQGTVAEAKRFLFLAAQPRLGSPTAAQQAAINAISDVGRLEAMAPRIHSASNWDELLGAE